MSAPALGRRRLAASAKLARRLDLAPDRAARFRLRSIGALPPAPSFAELCRWPGWPSHAADTQTRILTLVGLVAARDALSDEIDGMRLRSYAELVGEEMFEQLLALPPGGDRRLAPPAGIAAQGRRLAEGALPPTLAERLGHDAAIDTAAVRFVAEAEAIFVGEAQ